MQSINCSRGGFRGIDQNCPFHPILRLQFPAEGSSNFSTNFQRSERQKFLVKLFHKVSKTALLASLIFVEVHLWRKIRSESKLWDFGKKFWAIWKKSQQNFWIFFEKNSPLEKNLDPPWTVVHHSLNGNQVERGSPL